MFPLSFDLIHHIFPGESMAKIWVKCTWKHVHTQQYMSTPASRLLPWAFLSLFALMFPSSFHCHPPMPHHSNEPHVSFSAKRLEEVTHFNVSSCDSPLAYLIRLLQVFRVGLHSWDLAIDPLLNHAKRKQLMKMQNSVTVNFVGEIPTINMGCGAFL